MKQYLNQAVGKKFPELAWMNYMVNTVKHYIQFGTNMSEDDF